VAESLAGVTLDDLASLLAVPREPILTARLRLEPVETRHAEGIHAAAVRSRAEMLPWMPWAVENRLDRTQELSAAGPARWAEGREHHFAITRDGAVLGVLGINQEAPGEWELFYWIASEAAGSGLTTEAAAAVLTWTREHLYVKRFTLWAGRDNAPSRRVAEKLGFRHLGPLPEPKDGGLGTFPAELYERTDR